MHIQPSVYTAWLALSSISTVTAFYPYQPQYGDDDGKPNARRASEPAIERPQSITLPIRRARVPLRRDNIYNIVNSNDPTQKNSVAIDQDGNDLSYMVAVTIGDSKEEYHLLLDSAASNTWVMGQDCKSDACGTHNTFGNGDSSTLKVGNKFTLAYNRFSELPCNTLRCSAPNLIEQLNPGLIPASDRDHTLLHNVRYRHRLGNYRF
jgi:hypothetical protein